MRLIDADGLKERLKEYCIDGDKVIEEYYELMGIDECVDETPTVDAVEVVRCKDCQYYKPFTWANAVRGWCYNHWKSEGFGFEVREIDFCSYGERKNDD